MAKFAQWCIAALLAFGPAVSYGQDQTTFRLDKPAVAASPGSQQLIFRLEKPEAGITGARVFLSDSPKSISPAKYIGTVSFYPSNSDGPVEFVLPLKSAVRSASVLKVKPIRRSGAKSASQKLVVTQAAVVPVDNAAFR